MSFDSSEPRDKKGRWSYGPDGRMTPESRAALDARVRSNVGNKTYTAEQRAAAASTFRGTGNSQVSGPVNNGQRLAQRLNSNSAAQAPKLADHLPNSTQRLINRLNANVNINKRR